MQNNGTKDISNFIQYKYNVTRNI